jgi:hypothetical protein
MDEEPKLSPDELEREEAELLPDREAMSLIDVADPTQPILPAYLQPGDQ